MSDLIVIGYPDETTAALAADEARALARDLIIQPDAIASIVRDTEGKYHVHTSHHAVGAGASWRAHGEDHQVGHRQGVPGPGPRPDQARHVGPLPYGGESDAGQSGRGDEQVRRHRAEDLVVE